MSAIHSTPGTYLLLLKLPEQSDIEIGRSRSISLDPGWYCYVGSALGSGGLAARLRRHASVSVRKHWHIDYLLPHVQLTGALVREGAQRYECTWASWVNQVAVLCVERFGASDCKCNGHLFYIGVSVYEGLSFIEQAQKDLHAHYIGQEELTRLVLNHGHSLAPDCQL
jgi:Uri superfamily endonuclease